MEEEDGEEGRIEERDHAILHRVREQAPGPRGGEFEDVVEVPRDAPEPGGEEEGAALDLLAGLGVGDRVEGFDVSGSSMWGGESMRRQKVETVHNGYQYVETARGDSMCKQNVETVCGAKQRRGKRGRGR